MGMMLGYCKKCQVRGEDPRFFEVNTDHNVVICGRCGLRMTPKQAIANYDNLFDYLYKEAEILLFRARDAMGAYKAYARIIDLKPDDVVARFGRILSLVYISTLRKTNFDGALLMFHEEKKKYLRNPKYRVQYYSFIRCMNRAVSRYHEKLLKRLAYKNIDGNEYFYDQECVSLYFHRILQIRNFKQIFLEECIYLKDKLEDDSFEPLMGTLSKEVEELTEELKVVRTDVDGVKYTFRRMSENFKPIISKSDIKTLLHLPKFQRYSLEDNKEKQPTINNSMFKTQAPLYMLSKIAIPCFFGWAFTSAILFIVAAAATSIAGLFLLLGTICLSLGVASGVIHAAWQISCRLSNNYLLIKPLRAKKENSPEKKK